MASHAADRTTVPAVCGLAKTTGVVVTAATVKAPLEEIEAAQFENDRQTRLVWNPDPEVNSIGEHLVAALRDGVTLADLVAALLPMHRELLESNQRERDHERAATGQLGLLHRTLYTDGQRCPSGMSVPKAAGRLRGPLRIVKQARDAKRPEERPGWREFMHASWQIKDVVSMLPADTLRGGYMRNQLGAGPHDLLLDLLNPQTTTDEVPA